MSTSSDTWCFSVTAASVHGAELLAPHMKELGPWHGFGPCLMDVDADKGLGVPLTSFSMSDVALEKKSNIFRKHKH